MAPADDDDSERDSEKELLNRRGYLKLAGSVAAVGSLAGCTSEAATARNQFGYGGIGVVGRGLAHATRAVQLTSVCTMRDADVAAFGIRNRGNVALHLRYAVDGETDRTDVVVDARSSRYIVVPTSNDGTATVRVYEDGSLVATRTSNRRPCRRMRWWRTTTETTTPTPTNTPTTTTTALPTTTAAPPTASTTSTTTAVPTTTATTTVTTTTPTSTTTATSEPSTTTNTSPTTTTSTTPQDDFGEQGYGQYGYGGVVT